MRAESLRSPSFSTSAIRPVFMYLLRTWPYDSLFNSLPENPREIVSFLLSMIVLELKRIRVISATGITGDEEIYLFIPRTCLSWTLFSGTDIMEMEKIHEDVKTAHVKYWEFISPGLCLVSFIHGSTLRKESRVWISSSFLWYFQPEPLAAESGTGTAVLVSLVSYLITSNNLFRVYPFYHLLCFCHFQKYIVNASTQTRMPRASNLTPPSPNLNRVNLNELEMILVQGTGNHWYNHWQEKSD